MLCILKGGEYMKKIFTIILLIFVVCFFHIPIFSATDKTKDYSSINILDEKYSYGTIFWTDKTTIEKIKCGSLHTETWDGDLCVYDYNSSYCFAIATTTNEKKMEFKITNCAVDEDGDMCDVLFMAESEAFKYYPDYGYGQYLGEFFGYDKSKRVPSEECIRNDVKILKGQPGSLIRFWFHTNHAYANVKLKYFKAGTDIPAKVNGAVGTFYDIDVPVAGINDQNEYFSGCEGISISGYTGTVYCDKEEFAFNVPTPDGEGVQSPYGYTASDNPWTSTNALKIYNSAVIVQDMTDSTLGFLYSGSDCGITFSFASPYAFKVDKSTKTVSKPLTTDADTYYYTILQYIPNNYYASSFNFFDNYTGIYSDFIIEDIINNNLNVDTNNIDVIDSNGKDVTDYFNITSENNIVKVSATEAALKDMFFYNEAYKINIPVTVKKGTGLNTTTISNIANTKYTLNGTTTTLSSTQVSTKLQYAFKVNTSIDEGGVISNDYNVKVLCNGDAQYKVNISIDDDYILSKVKIDGKEVDISKLTVENNDYTYTFSDKNVTSNKEHSIIVETEPIKRVIEGKVWLDKDKNGLINLGEKYIEGVEVVLLNSDGNIAKDIYGNKIQSVKTDKNGSYKFENMTIGQYKVKIILETKYELTQKDIGTNQEINSKFNINNETDVITKLNSSQSKEIIQSNVNAGLMLIDSKVVVHHYKEGTTNKLIDDVIIRKYVDDDYQTQSEKIYGYEVMEEKPLYYRGQMTKEIIEVSYYYKLKDSEVIVKYLEEGTGKELFASENIKGKVFEKYETELKEREGYELVQVPENATGQIKEEIEEVNYYYKALPFDMAVEKYIEKVIHNGTEIAGNKENGNIVKVDVDSKNIENEEIKIQYKIKIKNNAKIAGTVGLIEDYIPEGLEFVAEDNADHWVQEGTKVTTNLLENDVLEPGQEIELTLVLRWKKSGENTGTKVNLVQILNQTNKYGFKDIDSSNDNAQTDILITVKTGEKAIGYGLIIGMLVLTLSAVVLVRRKANNLI